MAEKTTNSTPAASVDKISQMAQILMGEDEVPANQNQKLNQEAR